MHISDQPTCEQRRPTEDRTLELWHLTLKSWFIFFKAWFFSVVLYRCNTFLSKCCNAMHNWLVLCILMTWYFSRRASVASVWSMHHASPDAEGLNELSTVKVPYGCVSTVKMLLLAIFIYVCQLMSQSAAASGQFFLIFAMQYSKCH